MGERIDMSLDDIIRRKGKGKQAPVRGLTTRKNRNAPKFKKQTFDLSQKLKSRQGIVGDARLKIMSKQRGNFKDARDKLNQMTKFTDARQKLMKMKEQSMETKMPKFRRPGNNIANIKALHSRTMGQIREQLMNSRISNVATVKNRGHPAGISRTISQRGDSDQGPLGTRIGMRGKHVVIDDDGMFITTRNESTFLPQHQHQLQHEQYDAMDDDDVEMEVTPIITRQSTGNRLSASLQSRLDTRQTANEARGCRVIVSNLHPSVTQDDILELFADVGSLRRATLGKSGTAEIVFVRAADAQKACQAYHNRQLDGKPMSVKIAPAVVDIRGHRISPDAELIRKTLFSKSHSSSMMSRIN